MFRKILIVSMFATAAGYCFAAENLPQVVTSEVFYTEERTPHYQAVQPVYDVPVWPAAGSDADVEIIEGNSSEFSERGIKCSTRQSGGDDNIRVVSKIGADMVVENNFNLGSRGVGTWSGGANMLHGSQVPAGFDDCENQSEMPLLTREMLEDDGGEVLSMSSNGRKRCGTFAGVTSTVSSQVVDDSEIAVDESADAEGAKDLQDQVRSWVVASGQNLREVLQDWCNKEGWDLVWNTAREYPIEASAVFKGRFVDVSSALVRNFGRATPVPYAKFYKGNRVLVISTTEE